MVRIRTIASAAAEIKKEDPGTAITPYYIRRLIENGEVRSISDGVKLLVDFDDLMRFLCNGGKNDHDLPDGS